MNLDIINGCITISSAISFVLSGLLIFTELIDAIFLLSNDKGLAVNRYDFPVYSKIRFLRELSYVTSFAESSTLSTRIRRVSNAFFFYLPLGFV